MSDNPGDPNQTSGSSILTGRSDRRFTRRGALAILGGSAFAAAVGGAAAGNGTDYEITAGNQPPGMEKTARVRIGHLSPDTPAVDVYVGRGSVDPTAMTPTIPGAGYQDFFPNATGDYIPLASGGYTVKVTPAGDPETVAIEAMPELMSKTGYTILAVGELSPEDTTFSGADEAPLQPLPLIDFEWPDNGTTTDEDEKALARFVHASPDAEAVDLVVKGGPTIAEGVTFGASTGYLSLDPGEYTVQVKKGEIVAIEATVKLEAGDKVTAYVVGNAQPDDEDNDIEASTGADGAVGRLNVLVSVDGNPPDH